MFSIKFSGAEYFAFFCFLSLSLCVALSLSLSFSVGYYRALLVVFCETNARDASKVLISSHFLHCPLLWLYECNNPFSFFFYLLLLCSHFYPIWSDFAAISYLCVFSSLFLFACFSVFLFFFLNFQIFNCLFFRRYF